MKRVLLAAIIAAQSLNTFAQSRADYDVAVDNFRKFYNRKQADSLFNLFGDRIKSALPFDKTVGMIDTLHKEFGVLVSCEYLRKDEHFNYYKSNFTRGKLILVVGLTPDNKLQNFRFSADPNEKPETPALPEKSNFVLMTKTGSIYGTLVLPDVPNKMPVVLIIAGSGPTDRNGNCKSLGLNAGTYRMLADSLLQAGIASVRYDKRGVGESATALKDESTLHFDDMVDDAAGFIKMLKNDKRFSKVIVLGHSEGSLIGMLAAYKAKAGAYISVAGLAERADKTLKKQLTKQSEDLGKKGTVILDSLAKGFKVTNVDPDLSSLFRPAIQPYMISWLKYDPQTEIKKLTIPVYILQGTTDIQVDEDNATMLKKAYPKAKLKIVPGMNHVLKQASSDMKENVTTYTNPSLPLCPGFMQDMVKFINQK